MLAFLDTEFTDLIIRPRLLSVGIVCDSGRGEREFYSEVTDRDRLDATNTFGQIAVLSQFGKVAHAACTYAELGARLSTFFGDLVADLPGDPSGEWVELAFGYHLDWELLDLAAKDGGSESWESTRRRIRPLNIYELTGSGAGRLATEAYFEAQTKATLSRHHALCDARALRLACEAATRTPGAPNGATVPTDRPTHRFVAEPALRRGLALGDQQQLRAAVSR